MLAWIFRRCDGEAEARETPLGLRPAAGATSSSTGSTATRVAEALDVDLDEARAELDQTQEHLARFGGDLPKPIRRQFDELKRA